MKNLIEVSKVITKRRIKKIEIIDASTLDNKSSKFGEFYDALLEGKFRNDRDAATYLYKCSPSHDKYRKLKSRFKKRLLNTLFFLDINEPTASNYDRAYFSCNKEWTIVKILLANAAYLSAQDVAKSILSTALKFKFADIIVNCSRILRQFAAEADDDKEYDQYDQYIKEFSRILEAEIRSEELYQRIMMNYRKRDLESNEFNEQIYEFCDELISLSEAFESPVVNYNMYLVWTFRYEMQQDFEAMLEVCRQAEKYVETHPDYLQEDKLATFHIKKMTAYLHMRDFKNGKVNIESSLQTFPEGSSLWFRFMEYYILLAFHTDNFINALAIFNRATGHARFSKLDIVTKEKWRVFEVYLNYYLLTEVDKMAVLKAQPHRAFRVSRFLSETILFPKDQRVYTVHMLIVQVLFLIERGQHEKVAEKVDRLRQYANRGLDKVDQARMILFIRYLQQVVRAGYKLPEQHITDDIRGKLESIPFTYRGQLHELEVVPYERLCQTLLLRLVKKEGVLVSV